jgi:hypothetical protein
MSISTQFKGVCEVLGSLIVTLTPFDTLHSKGCKSFPQTFVDTFRNKNLKDLDPLELSTNAH